MSNAASIWGRLVMICTGCWCSTLRKKCEASEVSGRRAHVVPDPARAGVVFAEAGVHQDGLGPAQDQPDVEVERERLVGGLPLEEVAGGRIALAVLQGVDLVHGASRKSLVVAGSGWPRYDPGTSGRCLGSDRD